MTSIRTTAIAKPEEKPAADRPQAKGEPVAKVMKAGVSYSTRRGVIPEFCK